MAQFVRFFTKFDISPIFEVEVKNQRWSFRYLHMA